MWYFAWMLGVGLACTFGIINAMWLEAYRDYDAHWDHEDDLAPTAQDDHWAPH